MSQYDILSAIRQIAVERKVDPEDVIRVLRDGIKQIYINEKGFEDKDVIEVQVDPEKSFIGVFIKKTVVEKVEDDELEITLSDAKKINAKAKLGGTVLFDITPEGDFGRIAAQAARQVIMQGLREVEKEAVMKQFQDKVGSIISVVVQRVLPDGDVICEVNKARAVMPKNERIPFEFYKLGSSVKVLLKALEEDTRGRFMLVSRADNDFLEELFKLEVPEIESGSVEIMSIARDPGSRSKVAVRSNSQGVDPIGACVGQKGVRINSISNELRSGEREEKIDIILWDDSIERFLMNSISPAEAIKIDIQDKKNKRAVITVPDEKLSLAIGREGQNTKLASRLTGWELDIQGETLNRGDGRELANADESTDALDTEATA